MEQKDKTARRGTLAKVLALMLACACALGLFSGCKGRSAQQVVDDIEDVIDVIDAITATETPDAEATEGFFVTDAEKATPTPAVTEEPAEKATATPTAKPTATPTASPTAKPTATPSPLDEDGYYYSKEEVALYIHIYGKLPSNFITKNEAKKMGWSGNGSDKLEKYAPGMSIGGDNFGNYEKLLPTKSGRKYYECDIDTLGKVRGVKRIVFSNDGLVYYTEDHYETFTLLYGKP